MQSQARTQMQWKVLKFGGTSVATVGAIRRVVEIVARARQEGPLAVVVSALGGVTNRLAEALDRAEHRDAGWEKVRSALAERHRRTARELLPEAERRPLLDTFHKGFEDLHDLLHGVYLLREASLRTRDGVLSYGERLSAPLVAAALSTADVPAEACDARSLIVTDTTFGNARVDEDASYPRIAAYLEEVARRDRIPVVTGFLGATENGETTTLGRGGSDLTAALLGAAAGACAVELWTDVAGVMSADPRRVPDAFPLLQLSYAELMELSHFGAKVVYPPTVHPARRRGIPLLIKSTFEPDAPGTRVEESVAAGQQPVRAVSSIPRVALMQLEGDGMIGVPGIAARLFGALARRGVSIILISQASSEHSICFAVAPEEAEAARRAVDEEFRLERRVGLIDELAQEEELAILAAVGEGMRERPGIAGRLFGILGAHGVNVRAIAQGSSELNVSMVVHRRDETRALQAIHGAFFAPRRRRLEIAVAGTGRVAAALLDQLAAAAPALACDEELELALVALWNRRAMALAPEREGLGLGVWRRALEGAPQPDLEAVRRRLAVPNAAERVFVDATASPATADLYRKLLGAGVAVVAANKLPFAGPFEAWRSLVRAAAEGSAPLRFEATVGAGLPVLSTLSELVRTGDRVRRIEGLLSGTLGFVLDRLAAGTAFSEAVRQAHEKGFTEPHPAEDLSAGDVVRKLIILARGAGVDLEPEEVEATPLLPPAEDWRGMDLETFWCRLPGLDAAWAEHQAAAAAEGKRLRAVASLEGRRAKVAVEAVGADHPCYGACGTDNLIAFTTDRYCPAPLVIAGPGAGPEVTAAGVFADVLRAAAEMR